MASLLRVDPPTELVFNGPFTEVTEKTIHLTNLSDKDVCYKVKTTAPRRYCVRPNNGIIGVGKEQDILVLLQPFEYDPQDKSRHKFMVQCIELTPEEKNTYANNTEPFFKDIEKSSPERITDTKLKCTFVAPQQGGSGTDRSSARGGPEVQVLETEVSQLRQELTKTKEESARLSQTNSELQKQMSRNAEELQQVRKSVTEAGPGKASGGTAITLVLILVALCLGAALGVFFAPMVSLGGEL